MHDYTVARSMCLSPIMGALTRNGIKLREAAHLSGIDRKRIVDISMGLGDEANIDEVARLAALVGMELSVVPEEAGIWAFTEFETRTTKRDDMLGYVRRIIAMTDKVADFCMELRSSTGLPSPVFERRYGVEEGLMDRLADHSRSAGTTLAQMYAYLNSFGATLAAFPKSSPFNSYSRAVELLESERKAQASASVLKVA